MLSFANTHLSFYLVFLLCIAGLAASAPTAHHGNRHSHHRLNSGPFPYGKLADKILNVNDRNYDISYMIDDLDEDMVRYPEGHSIPFSSDLPIASFEPKPPPSINTIPNVGTNKNLFSFAYRMPDIIKKVVAQEWGTAALVRWRTMARESLELAVEH